MQLRKIVLKFIFSFFYVLVSGRGLIIAEPLKEFQFFKGTIKMSDIAGKPISSADVYGYCMGLHLLWPRILDEQYHEAWKHGYFARTNNEGVVTIEVPRGKWRFCAIGSNNDSHVICVASTVEVQDKFEILLKPEKIFESSFQLRRGNTFSSQFRPDQLFIKPTDMPLYVPIASDFGNKITFEITDDNPFYLWSQGETEDKTYVGVINWGTISENVIYPRSLNQILFEGNLSSDLNLRWIRRWWPGLSGSLHVSANQKIIISNGEFSIGYRRKVGKLSFDFVPKCYTFSGATKKVFYLNDNLRVNLWTQNVESRALLQLFLIDDNGHHARSLFNENGGHLEYTVTLNSNAKEYKPPAGGVIITFPDIKLTDKDRFKFSIPLSVFENRTFQKSPFVKPSSRHFSIQVPADLTNFAVNYLDQFDKFEERMGEICGRTKQTNKTELRLNIESRTTGELHGRNITTGTHVLFKDFPPLSHSCPHELAHCFGFNHGGLQETVVEATRSWGNDIIFGQNSKWLFFDRMNDRKREERWYPHTGIYLWGYSQGGQRFLHILSRFEQTLFEEGRKNGFSNEEIIPAMFSIILKREMFEIASKYGLCSNKHRYDKALKLVERWVEATER